MFLFACVDGCDRKIWHQQNIIKEHVSLSLPKLEMGGRHQLNRVTLITIQQMCDPLSIDHLLPHAFI
jgi:hypothetical protein